MRRLSLMILTVAALALAGIAATFDGAKAHRESTVWERTFGRVPVGSSLLMGDSEGHLSLADNQGDAGGRLGLVLDQPARISAPV